MKIEYTEEEWKELVAKGKVIINAETIVGRRIKVTLETEQGVKDKFTWNKADDPPEGQAGCWTKEVVVLTNLGNIFPLKYYKGTDGGLWQRLAVFKNGEKVDYWAYKPEGY